MGCDIHCAIQVYESGRWIDVPYQEDRRAWIDRPLVEGYPVAPPVFGRRNYDLFGILANVRNGRGFAGCPTGEGWPSIAPARGWLVDFDPSTVSAWPEFPDEGPRSLGDHSFTWVSLEELRTFPWDTVSATLYGVVPAADYERISRNGGIPDTYSGGITGPGIRVYTTEEYEAAQRDGALCQRPYVQMRWTESARSATGDWPGAVVPWLADLAAGRPLRLILGFDS